MAVGALLLPSAGPLWEDEMFVLVRGDFLFLILIAY